LAHRLARRPSTTGPCTMGQLRLIIDPSSVPSPFSYIGCHMGSMHRIGVEDAGFKASMSTSL